MSKPNRKTKQQVEDERRAATVSPTAFVARDDQGNELGIYDYGEFAGVGSTDMPVADKRLKLVDPKALFMALKFDPKFRDLPGSDDVLNNAKGDWIRPLLRLMRLHGISEVPGVEINYQ